LEIKQSLNILNWYPLKEEQDILEIGIQTKEMTKMFCKKCNEVTTIEPNKEKAEKIEKIENLQIIEKPLNKLELNNKYDIITLIGINERTKEIVGENLKLTDIIKLLEKYLKPEGKILIAVDNKFGLRFFAGDPENILNRKFESLIGYNNEPEKIETFTKSRLERILKENGYKTNFYYPLPDYRMPNVIFSDKQLPNYTNIDKYTPYHTEKSDILINEIDVFREILKSDEDMFTFFTNSFLIEACRDDFDNEFKYISFNNLRKEEYQLITKISQTYVEKQVVSEKSREHYENVKNNIKILKQCEIGTLDYIENEMIKSRYIEQKYLLDNILAEKLENDRWDEFEQIINKYIEIISKNTYKETDYKKTVFGAYNIEVKDESIIKGLHFLENGLWDMTFKNCFYVDDKFLFFDQEWNEPNMPYEYILYRSILYTISLRRFIRIEDLYEKYNLTKYLSLFKILDDKIQEEIKDNEAWKFYSKNKYFNIDDTKQEVINLNVRRNAQQGAIDNLQKENKILKEENIKIKSDYENYRRKIQSKTSYKIYKKLKKLAGGRDE